MKMPGRNFSVIGMGKSGLSAARLIARLGGDCVLSDRKDTPELRAAASDIPVERAFGREVIRAGDVVVMSPGIPPSAPAFREAYRLASEVIGEVELFYRLFPGRIVAVTGTDGKSTVTTLIAHLLRAGGLDAHAGGNLGNPLCDMLSTLTGDSVVVAEVSCFQLLACPRLRPHVALVTNLAEDHLEHHGSFEAYIRAKARVLANQAAGDTFVRNLDDPILKDWLKPGDRFTADNGQRVLEASQRTSAAPGAYAAGGRFHLADSEGVSPVCEREAFPLIGAHNTENAVMALAACIPFGIPAPLLAEGLASYKGLPHRIEFVREVDGVRFYNDSKATNPHAAITALRAFEEPVVLVAGGHEKGLPLGELASEVARRCVAVVLVGQCAERMRDEFPRSVPIEVVSTLADAVGRAFHLARPGRPVLFSPAASSYDQFHGFEERGERFRELVTLL